MTSEYIDSRDSSWHKPRDIQNSASQYKNTIQLLAKTAVEPGQEKHYYYVYTNNSGQQYYLAGYPENPKPPFGNIVQKSGEYQPGTPDFKDSVRVGIISSNTGNSQEVYNTFQNMKSAVRVIQDQKIPYQPLHENSNAAAISALYGVDGIQFGRRSLPTPLGREDVKAPGQDIQLIPIGLIKSPLPGTKSEDKNAALKGTLSQNTDELLQDSPIKQQTNRSQFTATTSQANNSDLNRALSMLNEMKSGSSSSVISSNLNSNPDIDAGLKILSQIKEEQQKDKEPTLSNTVDKEPAAPSKSRGNEIGGR
jgi:hypothetical protein